MSFCGNISCLKSLQRVHVFKWLAAIALDLGDSIEPAILRAMLPPLQRELDDQSMVQG